MRKMKKIIKIVIIFIFAIVLFNIAFNFFKKYHNINYKITSNNEIYEINEIYKDNKYYELIKKDNYKFLVEIDNKYNKKKKIIQEIKLFEINDYKCIYIPNTNTNIVCSDIENNYSYFSSKGLVKDFVLQLQNEGYNNSLWQEDSNETTKTDNVIFYKNNFLDNNYLYLYKYDGFYSINSNYIENIKVFENDTYINEMGTLVDKYYVIPALDNKYEYSKIYIIDVTNDKIKEMNLKNSISKSSHILGVVNEKLYIFDPDKVAEYEIDPKKKKITEIGNIDKNGKYYNGTWNDVNIYDFKDKTYSFTEKYEFDESNYTYIEKYENNYYYQKDENVYAYNTITKIKTLLFSLTDINNLYLSKNNIYILKSDTIYCYSNGTLRKILTYEELKFNNKNRYAVYTK